MEQLIEEFSLGLFFWQTLLFIALLLLLWKFAWKPILHAVNDREEGIKNALAAAEDAKKEMQNVTADSEKLLQEARAEREVMLKEAREIKEKIVADAREVAQVEGDKQLAVFSEIYYEGWDNDWKAYIDGEPVDHIRVNYLLRGLMIPGGKHKVEFKFEPVTYYVGEKINLAGSILLFGFVGFAGFMAWRRKDKKSRED